MGNSAKIDTMLGLSEGDFKPGASQVGIPADQKASLWQQISDRRGERRVGDRRQGDRRSTDRRSGDQRLSRSRPVLRASIGTVAAMAVIAIGLYWLDFRDHEQLDFRNAAGAELAQIEEYPKAAFSKPVMLRYGKSKVNLAAAEFSYSNGSARNARIGKVHMQIRRVKKLRAQLRSDGLHLYLKSGFLAFNYKKKKRNMRLHIHTPKARFEVVGTKFILDIRRLRSSLLVQRGQVRAVNGNRPSMVTKSHLWSSQEPVAKPVEKKATKLAFRRFEAKKKKYREMSLILPKVVSTKQIAFTTIYLKDGQIIEGEVVARSRKRLLVQSKVAGEFEIDMALVDRIE